MKEIVDRDFDETSAEFTLDTIAEMELQNYAEQINDISNSATMELNIEVVSWKKKRKFAASFVKRIHKKKL